MSPDDFTKKELAALAREHAVPGRSSMTKAELFAAIEARGIWPEDPSSSSDSATRRKILAARMAGFVDQSRSCRWRSVEGHPCGLPTISGADSCALHGGIDIADKAIPATGRLGFDTWPKLLRHIRLASYDVDPIGLDPVIAEMFWHLANYLYFDYFRVVVEGIEHVPVEGPALLVGNHGGAALPYDGVMLAIAVMNELAVPRRARVMGTEIFNLVPTASHLYRKIGGVYASRADAAYLLQRGHIVGVFPEGDRGFQKPFSRAYQVQRFGRGGFVTMAERHGVPVIPVAIIGSDEVHPAVFVSKTLARMVRFIWPDQRVEEIAVFLNLIPLPIKWRIRFLPPIQPTHPGKDPDPLEMLERTESIRAIIQSNLTEMLRDRGSAI